MIQEIGTVVELHEDRALVRSERTSACEGCSSSGFCHLSEGGEECLVEADNRSNAQVGQKVRLSIPTASFLKGTFFLYLFPLIGLFAGMGAGLFLAAHFSKAQEETFAAAGAVVGLILFFALQRLLNRWFVDDRRYRPVIVDVL